jgi:hypothetical protein
LNCKINGKKRMVLKLMSSEPNQKQGKVHVFQRRTPVLPALVPYPNVIPNRNRASARKEKEKKIRSLFKIIHECTFGFIARSTSLHTR